MSNKKDSIIISLDQEMTERKTEDNNIYVKISNESVERAENDAICRIKIAEESAKRAEENSKLSIRISDSEVKESAENSKLHLKILELEDKINKLSFVTKKEEPKKVEAEKVAEELPAIPQIPTFGSGGNNNSSDEAQISQNVVSLAESTLLNVNVGEWATIINNNTGIIESVQGIARIKPEDSQAGINTILRILNYEDKEYNLTNVYKYANYDEKKILLDILLLAFRAAKSDGKNDELVNFMIDKFFKKSYENIEYIPYYDELILVEIENEMKNKEYVLDDIVQVGN